MAVARPPGFEIDFVRNPISGSDALFFVITIKFIFTPIFEIKIHVKNTLKPKKIIFKGWFSLTNIVKKTSAITTAYTIFKPDNVGVKQYDKVGKIVKYTRSDLRYFFKLCNKRSLKKSEKIFTVVNVIWQKSRDAHFGKDEVIWHNLAVWNWRVFQTFRHFHTFTQPTTLKTKNIKPTNDRQRNLSFKIWRKFIELHSLKSRLWLGWKSQNNNP